MAAPQYLECGLPSDEDLLVPSVEASTRRSKPRYVLMSMVAIAVPAVFAVRAAKSHMPINQMTTGITKLFMDGSNTKADIDGNILDLKGNSKVVEEPDEEVDSEEVIDGDDVQGNKATNENKNVNEADDSVMVGSVETKSEASQRKLMLNGDNAQIHAGKDAMQLVDNAEAHIGGTRYVKEQRHVKGDAVAEDKVTEKLQATVNKGKGSAVVGVVSR